jgi:ABC-type transport system substrate-binding protein
LYKPEEVLELFKESGANVGLIDPFTGLDRQMGYEGNYEFMNKARQFCNQTGITIYINTHPNTESGRTGNIYQDGELKGHLKPPLKGSYRRRKSIFEPLRRHASNSPPN